jgi:hypothetical protein
VNEKLRIRLEDRARRALGQHGVLRDLGVAPAHALLLGLASFAPDPEDVRAVAEEAASSWAEETADVLREFEDRRRSAAFPLTSGPKLKDPEQAGEYLAGLLDQTLQAVLGFGPGAAARRYVGVASVTFEQPEFVEFANRSRERRNA